MDDGMDGWKVSRKWMTGRMDGWKASRKRTTTSFNICNMWPSYICWNFVLADNTVEY
jgi:hypothetical protein